MSTAIMASLSVFALLTVAAAALNAAMRTERRILASRFAALAARIRIAQLAAPPPSRALDAPWRLLRRIAALLPEPNRNSAATRKTRLALSRAGFTGAAALRIFTVVRFAIASLFGLVALGAGAVGQIPAPAAMAGAIAAAACGLFVPNYVVASRTRGRQAQITRELSNALDLIVVCVEAGLGIQETLKLVGHETRRHGQILGRDLLQVSAEVSAGFSLGESLRRLADRTAADDLRALAAALIASEQLGTQIAPALRASADELRIRRRLRAEEAAQKASVKIMIPLVIFVMPAMLIAILGPAVLRVLRTLSP